MYRALSGSMPFKDDSEAQQAPLRFKEVGTHFSYIIARGLGRWEVQQAPLRSEVRKYSLCALLRGFREVRGAAGAPAFQRGGDASFAACCAGCRMGGAAGSPALQRVGDALFVCCLCALLCAL